MAQGKGYLKKNISKVKNASAKPSKKVKAYSHKFSAAKNVKKGNPTVEVRRNAAGFKNNGGKEATGVIHRNIEEVMASRVLQSGASIALRDVKSAGKERLKEINKKERTKKKSRAEQKLRALEQSIKAQEEGLQPTKRPTAAALTKL